MIRQCLKCYNSKYKNKEAAGSRIRNMPGSTDREECSTNRDTDLQNLIKSQQLIKPTKWLGFQIYFTKYLKEILRHVL